MSTQEERTHLLVLDVTADGDLVSYSSLRKYRLLNVQQFHRSTGGQINGRTVVLISVACTNMHYMHCLTQCYSP